MVPVEFVIFLIVLALCVCAGIVVLARIKLHDRALVLDLYKESHLELCKELARIKNGQLTPEELFQIKRDHTLFSVADVRDLREEIQSLQALLDKETQARVDLEAREVAMDQRISNLRVECDEVRREKAALEMECNDCQDTTSRLGRENKLLCDQVRELETVIAHAKAALGGCQKTCSKKTEASTPETK